MTTESTMTAIIVMTAIIIKPDNIRRSLEAYFNQSFKIGKNNAVKKKKTKVSNSV